MANLLYISKLNPVSFREINPTEVAKYLSRQYDDYHYAKTLQPWEERPHYCQRIQKSDITRLQFLSNFSSIQIDVIDGDNRNYLSENVTQLLQDKYNPGWWAFEAAINWAAIPEGEYYITLTIAGILTMISESINIKTVHPNTINFEYRNSRYHEDVIFETGIVFSFRVEAHIGRLLPGTDEQYYNDQNRNTTLLKSKPYNNFALTIGDERGVPDWVVEKINYIWSCNNVLLDGRPYAKVSDGKFSFNEEELYPMRGIQMEITPGINRGSKVISANVDPTKKIVVSYNIDSALFGGLGTGNTIVITDFE